MMKQFFRLVLFVVYLFIAIIALLETAYRFQWIDFYSNELHILSNEKKDTNSTILIGGDSFSAGKGGYAQFIQNKAPFTMVINSSIPGTGPIEASMVLPGRVKNYQPDIFIYQLYVGNDLSDIQPPVNWKELSISRNLYWSVMPWIRSLGYINYKLGRWGKPDKISDGKPNLHDNTFSSERYIAREKLLFKAQPDRIEKAVFISDKSKMDILKKKVEVILSKVSAESSIYLLIIPHCAQINEAYQERMTQLGAVIKQPQELLSVDYPFINDLRNHFEQDSRVKVLNPLSYLRTADWSIGEQYFPNDPHLNALGQETIGKFVWSQLQTNTLNKGNVANRNPKK